MGLRWQWNITSHWEPLVSDGHPWAPTYEPCEARQARRFLSRHTIVLAFGGHKESRAGGKCLRALNDMINGPRITGRQSRATLSRFLHAMPRQSIAIRAGDSRLSHMNMSSRVVRQVMDHSLLADARIANHGQPKRYIMVLATQHYIGGQIATSIQLDSMHLGTVLRSRYTVAGPLSPRNGEFAGNTLHKHNLITSSPSQGTVQNEIIVRNSRSEDTAPLHYKMGEKRVHISGEYLCDYALHEQDNHHHHHHHYHYHRNCFRTGLH